MGTHGKIEIKGGKRPIEKKETHTHDFFFE